MHRIIVLEKNLKAREVLAAEEEVWIGRSKDFTIALKDRWVSRRHAVIRLVGGELFIEDLGSTTGTIRNGRRVPPGETVQLDDGDVVVCGSSTLVCRLDPDISGGPGAVPHARVQELVTRANARLVVLAGGAVRSWPVVGFSLLLGRGEACDIRIQEEGVASEHARILFDGKEFCVENRAPYPAVLVDGENVRTARLASNSVVLLGLAQVLFLYDYEANGEPVRDPIESISRGRFLSYLSERAHLSPSQVRRLRRARPGSNVRLGETAVRCGFLTPAFWHSLCASAVDDCARRGGGFVRKITSWFRNRRRESDSCTHEET